MRCERQRKGNTHESGKSKSKHWKEKGEKSYSLQESKNSWFRDKDRKVYCWDHAMCNLYLPPFNRMVWVRRIAISASEGRIKNQAFVWFPYLKMYF